MLTLAGMVVRIGWKSGGTQAALHRTLLELCDTNRLIGLPEEGIQQAKEASRIFERLGDTVKQAVSLIEFARLLGSDEQLDAAEEAASHAINLLPEKGKQLNVCQGHRALGYIYYSKGEAEKAIHHLEVALRIASSLNYCTELFWVHFALANLFLGHGRFDDAHAHIGCTKAYAVDDVYLLACGSYLQARVWYEQHMYEEAKSEALGALGVFEKLGATGNAERTRVPYADRPWR